MWLNIRGLRCDLIVCKQQSILFSAKGKNTCQSVTTIKESFQKLCDSPATYSSTKTGARLQLAASIESEIFKNTNNFILRSS